MIDTAPYWEAAAEGRLLIKGCNACGKAHFPPRPHCPFCMSADTAWRAASGEGAIYSYTLTKRGPAPAYITLQEGPTMLSALVDCDPKEIAIGGRVHVTFRALAEGQPTLPVFVLARG